MAEDNKENKEENLDQKNLKEDTKVSVDAGKVADTIADKIVEAIAKAQELTSKKEKGDLREHLFSKPSPANGSTSYDLKHMKLADFTLEAVKGLSEQYGDEKAIINPYAPKRKQRLMRVVDAAKILGFYRALLEKDVVSIKALSEGTDSEGGYLVPEEFRAEVIQELLEYSVMRNLARVFPMGTDTLDIPTLSARPAA